MEQTEVVNEELVNVDAPFTELFSIFIHSKNDSCNSPILSYDQKSLRGLGTHINNAIELLSQGLQRIGQLINYVSLNKESISDVLNIGILISLMGNLIEALNSLRLDIDYLLKK